MSEENKAASPNNSKNKTLLILGGSALLAAGVAVGFVLDRGPVHSPGMPRHALTTGHHPERPGHSMDRGDFRPDRKGPGKGTRGEMRADMQKWSEHLGKIREKYQAEIAKILRPEQKAKMEEASMKFADKPGRHGLPHLMQVVMIAPQVDRLDARLVLDDTQKKQVESILKKQREEVLAWVDANPPPKMEPPVRPLGLLDPAGRPLPDPMASFSPEPPSFTDLP